MLKLNKRHKNYKQTQAIINAFKSVGIFVISFSFLMSPMILLMFV